MTSLETIAEKIRKGFEILSLSEQQDHLVLIVQKDRLLDLLSFLKKDEDGSFDFLMDLCGVDNFKSGESSRFEAVYHFYSLKHNHRLRLRVKVSEENMTLPTATILWKSANWFEREAAEMFGFQFEGHPNPRHLLLFEGFEGHPLRKDYPIGKRQKIPLPDKAP